MAPPSNLVLAVALVVAVVALVAIIAVLRARRRKPAPPPELTPAPPAVTGAPRAGEPMVTAPQRPVALDDSERAAREASARAEAARLSKERDEAEQAGRADEAKRLAKAATEAQRRADYEADKRAEAAEKARRRAEADEKERAEREAKERAAAEAAAVVRAEQDRRDRLAESEKGRTLAEGLSKTRGGFMAALGGLFGRGGELDVAMLGELEEILFGADIGVNTAQRLLSIAQEGLKRRDLTDPRRVQAALKSEIERIVSLDGTAHGALDVAGQKPFVIMIAGVNGTGKTTSAGKLAYKLTAAGKKVMLAAGDTFRAAAEEQLDIWAKRAGAELVRGADKADPASVVFEAVTRAKAGDVDVLIADTAGRLHTQVNLMEELKKVKRVMDKALPGAPHEVLLVVDATTGQNAIAQARQFHEALGLTGIVLTKLDGTAKGGVVIGICDELKIPVRYVGVGEAVGDLRAFDPREFVDALFAA